MPGVIKPGASRCCCYWSGKYAINLQHNHYHSGGQRASFSTGTQRSKKDTRKKKEKFVICSQFDTKKTKRPCNKPQDRIWFSFIIDWVYSFCTWQICLQAYSAPASVWKQMHGFQCFCDNLKMFLRPLSFVTFSQMGLGNTWTFLRAAKCSNWIHGWIPLSLDSLLGFECSHLVSFTK